MGLTANCAVRLQQVKVVNRCSERFNNREMDQPGISYKTLVVSLEWFEFWKASVNGGADVKVDLSRAATVTFRSGAGPSRVRITLRSRCSPS